VTQNPPTQYVTDANLAARQRLWAISRREPGFELFPWVLDLAGIDAGDGRRVLDVGCGNGVYERLLHERGHVGLRVALDLSAGMLPLVKHATRMQADVQRLPLGTDSFDVVLAPHMLYHVLDRTAAAREARRVLRPGGVFIAVTNGENNFDEFRGLVERAVGTAWKMTRPAEQHFSLENGAEQLRMGFEYVSRIDCPPSAVVVTDLDALRDYVESIGDHYEAEVGQPWGNVVDRVRELAADTMARDREIRLTTSVGAFVCR
jgi:Methylase involved in ubiquinone/menaquinone biosynthesis